jgi:uncharacterized repeat protein (TIGR04138 family)
LHPKYLHIVKAMIGDWYAETAEAAGVSIDGLLFVNDAMNFLPPDRRNGPDLGDAAGRHLTASDVCTAVREYAQAYFNNPEEARKALDQWGVRTSEDVGAIIFALVDAKFLQALPDDKPEAFNGVFTFEDLLGGIYWQAEPA